MSAIEFDVPLWDLSNAQSLCDYIDIVDQKYQLAGLIRESFTNEFDKTTFVSKYNAQTFTGLAPGTIVPIVSLKYQLPIGDCSYQLEDTVDGYKKITTASYDSTPLYIMVTYGHNVGSNVSFNSNTVKGQWSTLIVETYISKNLNMNNSVLCRTGTRNGTSINAPTSTIPTSYINLTNDCLFLFVGCHKYANGGSTVVSGMGHRYLQYISINRKNGRVVVYGNDRSAYTGQSVDILSSGAVPQSMSTISPNGYVSQSISNTTSNFMNWVHGSNVPKFFDGNLVYQPVYAFFNDGASYHIPEIITTKLNESFTSKQTFIVNYDGNLIKQQFLNIGLTEYVERPVSMDTTYSQAILFDPSITYTTNSVV